MRQLQGTNVIGTLLSPVLIEKEAIETLYFPKQEVLFSKEEIAAREDQLHRANVLGNRSKCNTKVSLYFEDIEGLKKVETTIWGVTNQSVILKKNITIPIHRIVKINII